MACALGFSISASVCTEAGRIFPFHPQPLRSQAALNLGILGARPVPPAQSLVLLRAGLNGPHLHWGRMGLSPTRERGLGVFGRKGSRQTHSFMEPYAVSAVVECGFTPSMLGQGSSSSWGNQPVFLLLGTSAGSCLDHSPTSVGPGLSLILNSRLPCPLSRQ